MTNDRQLQDTLRDIDHATGFAQGDLFESADQVRAYFTPQAQLAMFGDDAETDWATLKEWADLVIDTGAHCAFA